MERIRQRIDCFLKDFELLEDWPDQCAYLMAIGGRHPLRPFERSEGNRITGCQSNAWLHLLPDGQGGVQISVDSDALVIRGILGMLAQIWDGESPEAILRTDMGFLNDMGIYQRVTSSRATGIRSAIRQITAFCEKALSAAGKAPLS